MIPAQGMVRHKAAPAAAPRAAVVDLEQRVQDLWHGAAPLSTAAGGSHRQVITSAGDNLRHHPHMDKR